VPHAEIERSYHFGESLRGLSHSVQGGARPNPYNYVVSGDSNNDIMKLAPMIVNKPLKVSYEQTSRTRTGSFLHWRLGEDSTVSEKAKILFPISLLHPAAQARRLVAPDTPNTLSTMILYYVVSIFATYVRE
jgi:hypothetical protein